MISTKETLSLYMIILQKILEFDLNEMYSLWIFKKKKKMNLYTHLKTKSFYEAIFKIHSSKTIIDIEYFLSNITTASPNNNLASIYKSINTT